MSRIESGQIDLNFAICNLNDELTNVHEYFMLEIENRDIELKLLLPCDDFCEICTDKGKIVQTMNNIIGNTIKFTDEGSIEFGYTKMVDCFEFFVKNTGKGIDKDSQTKIFERFRQDDTALNTPVEGAGLGLTIAKAFIESLDGKIWVESELGKGSTFYFTIPINPSSI